MSTPAFVNIAATVALMVGSRPYAPAVIFPEGRDRAGRVSYTHLTFRQLGEESDRLASGLEAVGVGRGVKTALMVRPGLEFFAITIALFKLGAVLVLVDPGMGVKNLGQCLAEAGAGAFIGIPKAHAARVALGWARATNRVNVTVGRRGPWGGVTLDRVRDLGGSAAGREVARTDAGETAAILFTSGSTGPPKGVIYTHGIFATQVEILRKTFAIEPGEIDLATFPPFALFAPALGLTAIVPDMDATRPAHVDPRKIFEAIDNFGVTNMFGSPALLDRVGRDGEARGVTLPTLRRVISAGAPVRAHILERFRKMLAPGVQIFTPYGATEALPVSSIGSDEILDKFRKPAEAGAGVCVGRPIAPARVGVIGISDGPIAAWSDDLLVTAGQVGEIVVQGPVVTRSYHDRPEATALAKIAAGGGAFHHRMGDLGYFDAEGRLWFCGRKSHRVATAGGVLYTIPCEAIFNNHPDVARSALVGIGPAGAARPVVCVELKPESAGVDRKRVVRELLALGKSAPHTGRIDTFLFHPSFPVDIRHNAKIFREKLAVWAARKLR